MDRHEGRINPSAPEHRPETPVRSASPPLVRANPTSEVAKESTPTFTEQQQQFHHLMRELINAIRPPEEMTFPEYNPEQPNNDARAWCNTVGIIMQERQLTGSHLVLAMSKCLKGSAAAWLTQNSFSDITWPQLRESFLANFDYVETPAATLIRLLNDTPSDGECMSSYATRLLGTFSSQWKSMTVEQIAIAVILAHLSKVDSRLHRLACTTEVTTRVKLQQELMAITYRKRGLQPQDKLNSLANAKRPRSDQIKRCYNCGKVGHIALECLSKGIANTRSEFSGITTLQQNKDNGTMKKLQPTCYYCSEKGHIATNCPKKNVKASDGQVERRVDVCTVKPGLEYLLTETGEKVSFCFDSGAECSLLKESLASRFPGKRQYNSVILTGIGNASIKCTLQILTTVVIQEYVLQLLFHIVPDYCISNSVVIGRDLLLLGFSVEVSESGLILKKIKVVSVCDVGIIVNDFNDIDTDVSIEQKQTLVSLLKEKSKYFVVGTPTGRVSTGCLEIKLIDPNRTVQRRPYRLSPDERQVVRNKIKELLDSGIIRESCSPFASPILLVKKKDGTDRLCVDYRELNSNTVPDRYPLPLISDQIQRLVGAYYFTSLDMASGYHQIPVHEASIERTAFVTPDGQFEYVTMPFGLRNAPSVYQRAINKALGNLTETFAVNYIDDVIIPAKTVDEALDRLQKVLSALTDNGFSLNLKKCSFLKTRVEFLGYEVSAGEIRPNPRKIKALTELSPPQTVTQLRQFIGLASYFRQFVPGFSQKTAPLYRLTSGKGSIKWTSTFEQIRKEIIDILTDEPFLIIFDPDKQIELHTDASAEGYGAILIQKVEGKPRVVEYYSRRTTSAESRYHSYELETLAVVNAIKHFRHYLHGRKFTVVTDCNAVKASKSKVDLTPRVHRWWCFLQTFEFDIEYRQGKHMGHVDFLSRNPLPAAPLQSVTKQEQKQVNLTEISNSWLLAEQQKDAEIKSILNKLQANGLDNDVSKTYEVRHGVLHRKIERNSRSIWLPIIPRAFQWAVINHVHESIMHLGWEKTLEKTYCHYWFPHMNKYVRKFVDNCITCKLSKSHSGKVQAELHPIPKITIPWHTIHMDATGKLSGKKDTKEYVFVIIDAFTKFVILYHAMNIDSSCAIRALKSTVSLFGAPSRVIADQGRCFASKEFRDFCNSHNISLHLIATGTSRANGQVERVMSTLKNMLTAVELSNQKSWQVALPDVQLAINSTFNRTTKASPLELLIGKVARPLQLMTIETDENDIDIDAIRDRAALAITASASTEKTRFDKNKAKVKKFSVGDYVLLENHERNQTKLEPKFKGPFLISELLDGDRYLLKALDSNRTYKYAHDRLRIMPECYVPLELNSDLELPTDVESGRTDNGAEDNEDTHEDV